MDPLDGAGPDPPLLGRAGHRPGRRPDRRCPAVGRARPAPGYGRRSPWPWVALLAAALGLIVLTGEPRSMAEAEVVAAVVTLWLVLRPYGPGASRAGPTGERSSASRRWPPCGGWPSPPSSWCRGGRSSTPPSGPARRYTFFGAGSLRPAWTALLLVPDLFGGNGLWHQPAYFNSYNLPEVTGYVGLLPLVAALALATRCVGRRRDPRSADWGLWLLLGVLGLVLAWGSYTPLGHLFVHIPLFGKTRLQSRNLGIVDLALAVLLGFWADRALGRHPEEAGLDGGRRWLVTAPAAAAGLLCLAAIAIPGPLEQYFGTSASGGVLARSLTPWFLVQLGVAVVVTGLVLGWRRLSRSARRRCLTVVVVADIGLFMLSSSVGLTDGETVLEPTTAEAAAVLGNSGRFAIYDTAGPTETLNSIGQPDLNIFTKLPSVMGYGSILSNAYGQATGAHTLDTLSPCALADGAFVPLRLTTLLTLPAFVAPPAPASGPPIPPAACPGAPVPGTATRRTFYFGQQLPVASVALVRTGAPTASTRPLRLGVLGPGGGTIWPRSRSGGPPRAGRWPSPPRRRRPAWWWPARPARSATPRWSPPPGASAGRSTGCCRTRWPTRAGGTPARGSGSPGSPPPRCCRRCGSPHRPPALGSARSAAPTTAARWRG